jgi:hypothetical protein
VDLDPGLADHEVSLILPCRNEGHQLVIDPPLSQCKGRKKRPACFKPVVETIVKKSRTYSYYHTKQAHNIRTCPKIITVETSKTSNYEKCLSNWILKYFFFIIVPSIMKNTDIRLLITTFEG